MDKRLYCGAAKTEITPSADLIPWLFGLMGRRYGKIHDPLFLRVAAFRSGETTALIVVYDLDKATNPEEWTKRIEEESGVPAENILYLAIHTHTAPLTGYRPFEGPNFIGRKPPEVQEKVREYEEFLLEKLLETVKEAMSALAPARFGYACGRCDIGVNRCQTYTIRGTDGSVQRKLALGVDAEGTADHTLLAVRVENAETGAPIAFLTNYAVHCVAAFLNDCGEDTSFISGDIGGAVSRALEEEYPGSVALWTSGPAGDVNPIQMVQTFYPDARTGAPVERCLKGEDAADGILSAMAGRQLSAIRDTLGCVQCDMDTAEIRNKIDWAETRCCKGPWDGEAEFDQPYRIRTHLLQIGPLALIGVDGELYTSLGKAMQAVSPVKDTFILNHDCSLLLSNPGYILDDATSARLGELGGDIPGGRVRTMPGTVRSALEQSVRRLFENYGGQTSMHEDNSKCPCCGRHCDLSAPSCERGEEYLRTGTIPEKSHHDHRGHHEHHGHHRGEHPHEHDSRKHHGE